MHVTQTHTSTLTQGIKGIRVLRQVARMHCNNITRYYGKNMQKNLQISRNNNNNKNKVIINRNTEKESKNGKKSYEEFKC